MQQQVSAGVDPNVVRTLVIGGYGTRHQLYEALLAASRAGQSEVVTPDGTLIMMVEARPEPTFEISNLVIEKLETQADLTPTPMPARELSRETRHMRHGRQASTSRFHRGPNMHPLREKWQT